MKAKPSQDFVYWFMFIWNKPAHGFLTTCLQWTFITTTVFDKIVTNQMKYTVFSIKANKTSNKLHLG